MFEAPNNFYRTSIKALILDDEKRFLMILEDNGLWEMPGGGLDVGESPHDCLTREIKEEMSLKVTYINKQPSYFVSALNINGQWKTAAFYEARLENFDFKPTDECTKIKFFTKEEALKENLYPIIKEFIKEYDPKNHNSLYDQTK